MSLLFMLFSRASSLIGRNSALVYTNDLTYTFGSSRPSGGPGNQINTTVGRRPLPTRRNL
ncbi:hypothetical protein DAPPUDRAFT_236729 [Daphnia pulex]|uniref:Uncharacterized protein n=1 Tax=Daphnia pulex TaxID=6669 RepID=E9G2Y9_DAPPU|nr:hypothetical protein DAPPUDRAFT_236729 [Daphnia pulex]|eukprot:EFX86124.1 hypothetical protein DAPPUDRAFT_236729 [Daphnia pulex]